MSEYNKLFRKNYRNLYNYVYDSGDISFADKPFNELDALVMGVLSYLPFETVLSEKEPFQPIPLRDLIITYLGSLNVDVMGAYYPDFTFKHIVLCLHLLTAKRYIHTKVIGFGCKTSEAERMQFAALGMLLDDDTLAVSYRGTDNTFVGWKENLDMAFVPFVPGEGLATGFLKDIMDEYPDKKVRIFGHSKGGNFAVYAASSVPPRYQDRILSIYSLDGLAICSEMKESDAHKRIEDRIIHFIPEQSVIGMLLDHEKPTAVIRAHPDNEVFNQHDIYNWEVSMTEDKLVRSTWQPMGRYFANSLNDWFKTIKDVTDLEALLSAMIATSERLGLSTPDDGFAQGAKVIQNVMSMPLPRDQKRKVNNALLSLLGSLNSHRPQLRKEQQEQERKKRLAEAEAKKKQRLIDQLAAKMDADIRRK